MSNKLVFQHWRQVEVKYTREWKVAERAIQPYNQRASYKHSNVKLKCFSFLHPFISLLLDEKDQHYANSISVCWIWRQKNQIIKRNQKPCFVHCNNSRYPFCLKFCYELLTTVKALRWHCIKHWGYAESKEKISD